MLKGCERAGQRDETKAASKVVLKGGLRVEQWDSCWADDWAAPRDDLRVESTVASKDGMRVVLKAWHLADSWASRKAVWRASKRADERVAPWVFQKVALSVDSKVSARVESLDCDWAGQKAARLGNGWAGHWVAQQAATSVEHWAFLTAARLVERKVAQKVLRWAVQ